MNIEKLFTKSLDSFLKELQKEALWGEAYIEKTETLKIIYEPGRIDELHCGEEMGLSVRTIKKDLTTEFWVTNSIPQDFLKKFPLPFKRQTSFSEKDLSDRLNFLQRVEAMVPKSGHIKHYRILLLETKKEILIITPDKDPIKQKREYVRVAAIVVSEKDGVLERGYEAAGYTLPFGEVCQKEEFVTIGKRASELALKMLSARRAPAGVMPVVLAGEAGGTMIHEAVGHGLEADHAEEGLSVYSGKLGEKVASELITVIDDPGLFPLYGSYEYDDEGSPAQKVILIEKGILKNFLYDRLTALKHGKSPNGHGRRQSFKHIPIPRMANTYIAKGPHKPEEILKSIDRGLLVKKMGGGEVNPLTGDFVFEVREGYYIDKGEIAYPVKGATLVGNGPKVLELIDMVGDDLHFEPGTCGKDGQGVPVSDGQPTIRIPELTVGGELS